MLLSAVVLTLQLAEIQSRLLDVGSAVATPADSSSQSKLARVAFPCSATAEVEVRSAVTGTNLRRVDVCFDSGRRTLTLNMQHNSRSGGAQRSVRR
jgi:hypothetical protein